MLCSFILFYYLRIVDMRSKHVLFDFYIDDATQSKPDKINQIIYHLKSNLLERVASIDEFIIGTDDLNGRLTGIAKVLIADVRLVDQIIEDTLWEHKIRLRSSNSLSGSSHGIKSKKNNLLNFIFSSKGFCVIWNVDISKYVAFQKKLNKVSTSFIQRYNYTVFDNKRINLYKNCI